MSQTNPEQTGHDDKLIDDELIEIRPRTGIAIAVWAAIGLAAAFTLSLDKIKILENPDYRPSCDLNPVLACGSVIRTDQASVFGFPNPFLGLIGFSILLTLGVLMASNVRLPRWVLNGAALGGIGGIVFVHWLAYHSLYEINALCPWCLVVWTVTMPLAVWFLLLAGSRSRSDNVAFLAVQIWPWRFAAVAGWYLLVIVLITVRFWDYWRTLL